MPASWRRRSLITPSVTDRSSAHRLSSSLPQSLKGARVVQSHRKSLELASDTSSCSSNAGEEDWAAFVSNKRSSEQTPMKKLLALEMFKEKESKRRSPSVIARLMGLDGLPTQQPNCKQQRSSSNNIQHKIQKSSPSSSRRSSRKSSKDEQEFKDVFEVLDASNMDNSSYSSRGSAKSKPAVAEVALVQQKFMDAKHLSTDERFQYSKELDDAIEVLDASKDPLLQFLPRPDFLLRKHLHDLQSTCPQPHCSNVSAVKAPHSLSDRNGHMHKKEKETNSRMNRNKYPQNHQEVLNHSYGTCPSPPKPSKYGLQERDDRAVLPTRIVVLKPNPGKSLSPTRTMSPPRSSYHFSSDFRKHGEFIGVKYKDREILSKRSVAEDMGLSGYTSKESREIAKEITRQMRNNFRRRSMNFSNSALRGYAGDESSCDSSSSESGNDSDILFPSSKDIHDWNKQLRKSLRPPESFVSQEAKKRLSQRWKLAHASQDLDNVFRSNTLGEMLAVPDTEGRPANFNAEEGCSSRSSSNSIFGAANEPLGISSRDGWKDALSSLSRSRSVPSSSTGFGSPKRSTHHEILCRDKFVIREEGMKRERNKLVKGNFNQLEDSFSRNLRVRDKKAQSATGSAAKQKHDSELCFIFEARDSSKGDELPVQSLLSEPSACALSGTSSVNEYTVDTNDQSTTMPSAACGVESYSPSLMHDDTCNGNDISSSQGPSNGPSNKGTLDHPASELESQEKPKEGDQPSPISILEAPFADDSSSASECFESLSADLHGLRMQLKLLKLETEAYEEGPMLVSSDEDAALEGSVDRADGRWESCYLSDVLTDSGIKNADPDTFMATWHSSDCPVSPLVFEELEKKYCHQSRAERKLLFDWINSKLLEINQEFTDQHPWVKSLNRAQTRWNQKGLEDKLQMLLPGKHTRIDRDAGEKAVTKESEWLDLRDDIDVIGREVERWLIDELVTEVVAM